MGNCISQVHQTATLIDGHGRLRQVDAPITAAEVMLDEPGHIISPELILRQTRRVTAMSANDNLLPGKIYLLVPAIRANSYVSEPEMELVDYACEKNMGSKRRNCKTGDDFDYLPDFRMVNGNGFNGNCPPNSCQWRPVLEPIFEETGSFRVTCELNVK